MLTSLKAHCRRPPYPPSPGSRRAQPLAQGHTTGWWRCQSPSLAAHRESQSLVPHSPLPVLESQSLEVAPPGWEVEGLGRFEPSSHKDSSASVLGSAQDTSAPPKKQRWALAAVRVPGVSLPSSPSPPSLVCRMVLRVCTTDRECKEPPSPCPWVSLSSTQATGENLSPLLPTLSLELYLPCGALRCCWCEGVRMGSGTGEVSPSQI